MACTPAVLSPILPGEFITFNTDYCDPDVVVVDAVLLEDGSIALMEDGSEILMEG